MKLYSLKSKIRSVIFPSKEPPYLISTTALIKSIGKMSYHNGNFEVKGDQKVSIGSYCAIGRNVSIVTSNHDYNYPCIQGSFYRHYFDSIHPGEEKQPPNIERTKGVVRIGSDVWIADNVTILSGVSIGNGACIANNSVITKDIPAFSIVAGIPGRVLKGRYTQDVIEFLEELKWWEWSAKKIERNRSFFRTEISKISLGELRKIIVE